MPYVDKWKYSEWLNMGSPNAKKNVFALAASRSITWKQTIHPGCCFCSLYFHKCFQTFFEFKTWPQKRTWSVIKTPRFAPRNWGSGGDESARECKNTELTLKWLLGRVTLSLCSHIWSPQSRRLSKVACRLFESRNHFVMVGQPTPRTVQIITKKMAIK